MKTKYPNNRTIWLFACFGGVIGGGLITSPFLSTYPSVIFIGAIIGSIVGFVPAALTGILAAHYQLYRNIKGLLYTVVIGTAVTTILATLLFMSSYKPIFIAAIIGAVSSLLTALFALPKPKAKTIN